LLGLPSHCYSAKQSKMFGSSQGFGGETASPTAKRTRQEEKQTCVPVTVRMLQSAVADRTDESAEVLIHGSETGVLHLVGVVEAVVQQAAMLEFQLNDASGRIKVRHYTSGAGLGDSIVGVSSGQYISVIGNLRTSPAVHVSAMSFSTVKSADEISYHMIEVALATLRLRAPAVAAVGGTFSAGGLSLSVDVTPTKRLEQTSTISPMKVDAPVQLLSPESAAPPALQPAGTTDVRSSILAVLRQEHENAGEEGLALSNVLAKLVHCKVHADKVEGVLQDLVSEGEVFTTIDDEHFSLII